MSEQFKNNVKYMLFRYNIDSKKLSANLRLELIKRFIKNCVENEEYELANALKEKKNELIREIRLVKIGRKNFLEILFLKIRWSIRKLKFWLKS